MKVIYCKVGEAEEVIDIEGKLEDFQKLVGGYIEVIPYNRTSTLVYILNEEGKLRGLKANKVIFGGRDVIVGNFVVAKIDGEDIVGLSVRDEDYVRSTVNIGRVAYT